MILFIAVGLAGTGCAKPGAQLVGKWNVDLDSVKTGDAKKDANLAQAAPIMGLEFKPDNTYNGMMMEGTYAVKDHTLTLTPQKVMGMEAKGSMAKTLQGTIAADGKSLTVDLGGKVAKYTKAQ